MLFQIYTQIPSAQLIALGETKITNYTLSKSLLLYVLTAMTDFQYLQFIQIFTQQCQRKNL